MTLFSEKKAILYDSFASTFEKVEAFKAHLKEFATNKKYSDYDYINLRSDLLSNIRLKHAVPKFVINSSEPIEFWYFIRDIPFHEKRREFIEK